jgi:hypothetical protein
MLRSSKASISPRHPSRQSIEWDTAPLWVNSCVTTVTPADWSHHDKYLISGRGLWQLEDQDLWLITRGETTWRLGRQTFEVKPGVCLWLRPGMQGELPTRNLAETSWLWIHFDTLRSSRGPAFIPPIRDLLRPLVDFVDVDLVAMLALRVSELMSQSIERRRQAAASCRCPWPGPPSCCRPPGKDIFSRSSH